jgi:hypothetical protein
VTVHTPSQADPHAATPASQPRDRSDDDPMAEHFGAPPGSGSVIAPALSRDRVTALFAARRRQGTP